MKTFRNLAGAAFALAMLCGGAFAQSATSPRCLANAAAPAYAEGQYAPCSIDLTGNLRVNATVTPSGTQNVNVTKINGTTTSTGTGAQGAGAQRVTVATDSATVAGSATLPAGANLIGKIGIDQTTPGTTNAVSTTNFPSAVATGTGAQGATVPRVTVATDPATVAGSATLPAGTNLIGSASNNDGTNTQKVLGASTSAALADKAAVVALSPNPAPVCTGIIAINQTTSTDVKTFTNTGFICAVVLVSATAQNIGVDEGTGTVCATSPTALIGGTTASLPVAANGGFSVAADRTIFKTQVAADHLCVLQSGAGNVSGFITFQDHA